MPLRHAAPMRGLRSTLVAALMCVLVPPALAQPKKKQPAPAAEDKKKDKADPKPAKADPKVKNFDFNALDLNGRMRTPQLLYFLERANEELERASLEKRSFIPHIVRSVEEERL